MEDKQIFYDYQYYFYMFKGPDNQLNGLHMVFMLSFSPNLV